MAVDYYKLVNLAKNNYKVDLRKKLDEKYYEEFEKNFDSYFEPKYQEAMNEAIDAFYSHPEGKIYTRTGQFSSGRTLFNIHITKDGRMINSSEGEGFPSYPAMKIKGKWSRKNPWPGDEAWNVLFEKGLHGTGKMNIGKTSPTPYEIVDRKMQESINEYVEMIQSIIQEKYITQLQNELFNKYLLECI